VRSSALRRPNAARPPVGYELTTVGDGLMESLAIETLGGEVTVLVDAGTRLPVVVTETFTTVVDGQTSIEVPLVVVVGDPYDDAPDVRPLGLLRIADIEPLVRGASMVVVEMTVDVRGTTTFTARDALSEDAYPIVVAWSEEIGGAIERDEER
jgi:molecular chaperone DnaK